MTIIPREENNNQGSIHLKKKKIQTKGKTIIQEKEEESILNEDEHENR